MAECRPPCSFSFTPSPQTNQFPRVLSTEFSGRWVRVTVSPRPMCVSVYTQTHTCTAPAHPLGKFRTQTRPDGPGRSWEQKLQRSNINRKPREAGETTHSCCLFSGKETLSPHWNRPEEMPQLSCGSKNNSNSQFRKRAWSLKPGPLPVPLSPTSQTLPQSYLPPFSHPQQARLEIRDSWTKLWFQSKCELNCKLLVTSGIPWCKWSDRIIFKSVLLGTSLVVQWLGIHWPMQGTWVPFLGPGRFHVPQGN